MAINAQGFGQGFAQGFGLVRDTLNEQRRNRLQEEDMAFRRQAETENRAFRQDQANLAAEERLLAQQDRLRAAEDRDANRRFREQQANLSAEERAAAQTVRQSQIDYYQSGIDQRTAEKERQAAAEARQREIENTGIAADRLYNYLNDVRSGQVQFDAVRANELYNKTFGTSMDFGAAIDPAGDFVLQNFGVALDQMSKGQSFNEKHVVDAANHLTKGSAKVGMTISKEEFPNAPSSFTGGNHEIVGRQFRSLEMAGRDEETGDVILTGEVLVKVRDKRNGEIGYYLAPATEGRTGQGMQASFGMNELLNGYRGRIEFERNIKPMESELIRMRRETYRDSQGRFDPQAADAAELLAISNLRAEVEAYGLEDKESPMGGTYAELLADPSKLSRYAKQKAHFGRVGHREDDLSLGTVLTTVRGFDQYKSILDDKGEALTEREELELASLLGQRPNGKIFVEDKEAYIEFRNKIRNRRIGEENTSDARRGLLQTTVVPI